MGLRHQLITRQLFEDETIEGLVIVERPNHIITIAPREGSEIVLRRVSLGIRIPGDIQPVAPPTLPVMRRFQKLVDQLPVRVIRLDGYKLPNRFRRGRQAEQIKIRPPHQRQLRCFRRERDPLLTQSSQHKRINRCAHPMFRTVHRDARTPDRLKGPEFTFLLGDTQTRPDTLRLRSGRLGTGTNPALEDGDLPGRNRFSLGRHFAITHPFEQPAGGRITRDDGRTVFPAANGKSPKPQIQAALHFRFRSVTIQTMLPQDRSDVFFEQKFFGHQRCPVDDGNSQQHQDWCDAEIQLEEHTGNLANSAAAAILRSSIQSHPVSQRPGSGNRERDLPIQIVAASVSGWIPTAAGRTTRSRSPAYPTRCSNRRCRSDWTTRRDHPSGSPLRSKASVPRR